MHSYSFEKLGVWQDARKFTARMYKITADFPDVEKFGLTNQIRRAAVSIAANIAEGSGRVSPKDQAYFYQIAYSSTIEIMSHMFIAYDLNFIDDNKLSEVRITLEEITNKLNALRNAALKRK